MNMVPEMETKFCLAGQIIDEARHVEVFGRYLEKLGVDAPTNPALESSSSTASSTPTTTARRSSACRSSSRASPSASSSASSSDSPDPLMRDLIKLVLRDESRHAGFGVIYLADKFESASPAERTRVEEFVAELWRLFHHATASPFGPVNEFLDETFADIAHRLKLIGLALR